MTIFTPLDILRIPVLASCLALATAAQGAPLEPGPRPALEAPEARAETPLLFAQANCAGAAAQAAAQTGGQVLSVSAQQQNGRVVCVVTVLVPGQDGGRPRRTTITIPG